MTPFTWFHLCNYPGADAGFFQGGGGSNLIRSTPKTKGGGSSFGVQTHGPLPLVPLLLPQLPRLKLNAIYCLALKVYHQGFIQYTKVHMAPWLHNYIKSLMIVLLRQTSIIL